MPKQTLTASPVPLANLTADVTYTVQFRSTNKSYVQSASAVPTDNSEAFVLGTNGVVTVKKTGSNNVYVWGEDAGGTAVYDQSV